MCSGTFYINFTDLRLQLLPDPPNPTSSTPKPGLHLLCSFEHANHQRSRAAIQYHIHLSQLHIQPRQPRTQCASVNKVLKKSDSCKIQRACSVMEGMFWDKRLSIVKGLHPDQCEKGEKESAKEMHTPVRKDLPVEAGWH